MQASFTPGIPGFSFEDFFSTGGLSRLYQTFCETLSAQDPTLYARYQRHKQQEHRSELSPREISSLLCDTAKHVSSFVQTLFGEELQAQAQAVLSETLRLKTIFQWKDSFIKRRVLKRPIPTPIRFDKAHEDALFEQLKLKNPYDEHQIAQITLDLLLQEKALQNDPTASPKEKQKLHALLDALSDWLLVHRDTLENRYGFLSFRLPAPIQQQQLIPLKTERIGKLPVLRSIEHHPRDGFNLTDRRMSSAQVLSEADYCLYCHEREKDSCRKGFEASLDTYQKNFLGIELEGCPLDEKISEAHQLLSDGDPIAALAVVCIDNPMCPGTGHRVCNDCMRSCIYQKQTPVQIPEIETGILSQVLSMPYGVEIYGLLSRWNPLRFDRPHPLPYRGKNVLVVGLGPAGYTLCHYLAQEGFGVVGIDGLSLEPPPPQAGSTRYHICPIPIKDYQTLTSPLSQRPVVGFGGVSEYGITSRWDKNFLSLLYLTLARNPHISFHGSIRFGGTITLEQAFEMGFDHVAIATGAGTPTLLPIEKNLPVGMRQASDFLMTLQLQRAHAHSSLAQPQIELPAIVVGGGLTAVDTATELKAYYVTQAERTVARIQQLCATADGSIDPKKKQVLFGHFTAREQKHLETQLQHGFAFLQERKAAADMHRPVDMSELLDSYGGVSLLYRRAISESPAYRYNHEELENGLQEGIRYIEHATPTRAILDADGTLSALVCTVQSMENNGQNAPCPIEIPARTVIVAVGTKPNTMYEQEHPGHFSLGENGYFIPHRATAQPDGSITLCKDPSGVFSSYLDQHRTVSFYGDSHPSYAGSVVKAMASAKDGHAQVAALFPQGAQADIGQLYALCKQLDQHFQATVHSVHRLTPTIVQLVIHAPASAQAFQPGQFYRVQTTLRSAHSTHGMSLLTEGIALTGAHVDKEKGLLTLIVLEIGASSLLCQFLSKGDPISVMGPTGTPTHLPKEQYVCLVGGGLGNAVLLSIATALRANGCHTLYFAGYRKKEDMFYQEQIESSADQTVFCYDQAGEHERFSPHSLTFHGNIVQAMTAYAQKQIGRELFTFSQIQHMIVIGSDRMMAAVDLARKTTLKRYLCSLQDSIASINSPMQCMLKGICAQCLQRQVDGHTGKERFVFSCVNQDQPMRDVDFEHLSARLQQNSAQEKLATLWLKHTLCI